MSGRYPATPLLRKLSAWNGWRHDLIHDAHGRLEAVVYVRVGPQWTDSVAISGEDQTLAMRHRSNDDRLILPHRAALGIPGGLAATRPLRRRARRAVRAAMTEHTEGWRAAAARGEPAAVMSPGRLSVSTPGGPVGPGRTVVTPRSGREPHR
ncbi:MAG: hypothetical protein ACRDT0_02790 [Pseudonocardiaceae bacterium]